MIKWIEDVDTGELFPVQDDFEFEVPAHLEQSEYTPVDYDKTIAMTITELQNQLFSAQEHINTFEKSPKEISSRCSDLAVSEAATNKSFNIPWRFILQLIAIFLIVLVLIGSLVIFSKFISNNDFVVDTTSSEKSEQINYEISVVPSLGSIPINSDSDGVPLYLNREKSESDNNDEIDQESESTSPFDFIINNVSFIFFSLISILVLKFVISFMIKSVRGT